MGKMLNRIDWIDIAKGIGVIFVVLGHMPSVPEMIRIWIFSFHMPIFFFLSGYMFNERNLKVSIWQITKKKARRLLLPYCIYSFVFIVMDLILLDGGLDSTLYSLQRFLTGQGGYDILWFLFSLFIVEIIFIFIYKYFRVKWKLISLIIVICGLTLAHFGLGAIFKISTSLVALSFYSTGVILKRKIDINYFETHRWLVTLTIFINILFSIISINLYGYVLDMNSAKFGNFFLTYIAAMSGIYYMLYFSILFSKYKFGLFEWLKYIGKNSLYFYPLTAYIPNLIVSLLELSGINVNNVIKLISKICGFVGTSIYIEGKKFILRRDKFIG